MNEQERMKHTWGPDEIDILLRLYPDVPDGVVRRIVHKLLLFWITGSMPIFGRNTPEVFEDKR